MKKLLLTITFLFLIATIQKASAVALGVNKASLHYTNVLKGGYAQKYVTITTDSRENITLEHEFTGNITEWMRIEPQNKSQQIFSRDKPLRLTVIAEPSENLPNGTYEGELRLLTGEFARTEGQYGSTLKASFSVDINVEITGEQIQKCTAGGFDIKDTETGQPLELHASIQNTGNVNLQPQFQIDIWNKQQTQIVHTQNLTLNENLLPTTQDTFIDQFQHDLPIGQYWAQIREPQCENQKMITFNVLDIGGTTDHGKLLRIDNQPWANTDDIIRIAAIFKNTGERSVNAHFKGTIKKEDQVVEVIETDPLQVEPSQTQELETFFNPQQPGRYTVEGRVVYNNKLTFQKSSIINVKGDVGPRVTGNIVDKVLKNPYQAGTILVFTIIAILLFLIHKEKKRKY